MGLVLSFHVLVVTKAVVDDAWEQVCLVLSFDFA